MKINIELTSELAKVPTYGTQGSSGFDLYSTTELILEPGDRALIPTDIRLDLPEGTEVQIRPRSGLALKYGITVLNTPGTVDESYTGKLGVILINHGQEPFCISIGDRIAQGVLQRVEQVQFNVVPSLDKVTDRGEGGFGSTDVKSTPEYPKFKVRIIDNIYDHGFKVGDVVEVEDRTCEISDEYIAYDATEECEWYLSKEEFEVINEENL